MSATQRLPHSRIHAIEQSRFLQELQTLMRDESLESEYTPPALESLIRMVWDCPPQSHEYLQDAMIFVFSQILKDVPTPIRRGFFRDRY